MFVLSMTSDDIEKALQELVGASAGPPGLVITLRRHDEYEALLERISGLESRCRSLDLQVHQMSTYAAMYIKALDELRAARLLLRRYGEDTSFITSLKGK